MTGKTWRWCAAWAVLLLAGPAAVGQDAVGVGSVEETAGEIVVTGESDLTGRSETLLLEAADGTVEAVLDVEPDGHFTLHPAVGAKAALSDLAGVLIDPLAGAAVGHFALVLDEPKDLSPGVVTPFEEWFGRNGRDCEKNPKPPKGKRAVLYRYEVLKELFEKQKPPNMRPGGYFPNWPRKPDGTPTWSRPKNFDYIDKLAETGQPVGDTYLDPKTGEPVDTSGEPDSEEGDRPVIEEERNRLKRAGYVFNKDTKQWEPPPGSVWNEKTKRWEVPSK